MVIDGKIPEDVSRGNAEKPRPVPTTTLGIAKMLVMKRRIEFAPASGTFVVRGLFGPAHNVSDFDDIILRVHILAIYQRHY